MLWQDRLRGARWKRLPRGDVSFRWLTVVRTGKPYDLNVPGGLAARSTCMAVGLRSRSRLRRNLKKPCVYWRKRDPNGVTVGQKRTLRDRNGWQYSARVTWLK